MCTHFITAALLFHVKLHLFQSFLTLSWPTLAVNEKKQKSVEWCHSPPVFFALPTKGHKIGIWFVKSCLFTLPKQFCSGHYSCEKSGIILSLHPNLCLNAKDLKQNHRIHQVGRDLWDCVQPSVDMCSSSWALAISTWRYLWLGCLRTILSASVP